MPALNTFRTISRSAFPPIRPALEGYVDGSARCRLTVMLETSGWLAYVTLEDPPGPLLPITTVGRYPTVEEAQVATDEV